MNTSLIKKYNVPGPRYTSYPTVPNWNSSLFSEKKFKEAVTSQFERNNGWLALYIHLPFCESLCTYCGCNTRITQRHSVESSYIQALLIEWDQYLGLFGDKPKLKGVHLGGGTPTFFSAGNLNFLISSLLKSVTITSDTELSFEAHPDNTSELHLQTLYNLGFDRLSFGIQDFNPKVQKLINRKQSFYKIKHVTELARKVGYKSINYDLIYGLPGQTICSIKDTLEKTLALNPDRIAFYSYAHIPQIKPAQRSYERKLPTDNLRQVFYQQGKHLLTRGGFVDIGMDHFAKKSDDLHQAYVKGRLHRNFMGYGVQHSDLLIGLGASAISDTWTSFAQNEKSIDKYMERITKYELPISRGHILTDEDLVLRKHILNLICRFETSWSGEEQRIVERVLDSEQLLAFYNDRLITCDGKGLRVTQKGRPFIRNICMLFDAKLTQSGKVNSVFSKTI